MNELVPVVRLPICIRIIGRDNRLQSSNHSGAQDVVIGYCGIDLRDKFFEMWRDSCVRLETLADSTRRAARKDLTKHQVDILISYHLTLLLSRYLIRILCLLKAFVLLACGRWNFVPDPRDLHAQAWWKPRSSYRSLLIRRFDMARVWQILLLWNIPDT